MLIEARNFLLPDFFAGMRIEAHGPIVMQFEVEIVVPHAEPARCEARTAARLPVVVPQHRTITRVDRPDIIRRGRRVNHVVDEQNAATQTRRAAVVRVTVSKPPYDDWRSCSAATAKASEAAAESTSGGSCSACGPAARCDPRRHPLEAEVLHGLRVDGLQGASACRSCHPSMLSIDRRGASARPPGRVRPAHAETRAPQAVRKQSIAFSWFC